MALLGGSCLLIVAGAAALAHREPPPPLAEMAPPAPQIVSVAATKTDRADPLLDASFSYSTSGVAFRASSDFGPLMDVAALHGPAPRTIGESRRLRSAFLRPTAPPILVVAALPAPATPTEDTPDEPQVILAEPDTTVPFALAPEPEPEILANIPAPVPRPEIAEPAPSTTRPADAVRAAAPQDTPDSTTRQVRTTRTAAAPEADEPGDKPSIFQRLFGGQGKAGATLAYASTEKDEAPSIRSGSSMPNWFSSSKASAGTAVYDISARTVYMPNGERLEAHSGFGDKRDNPRYVNVKMKGATPPHTYDLTERESLFHGVQALRLTPVGGNDAVHGRVGLLAHTYMLGPRGDSNGCVSFKDYNKFLQAYRRGEVRRLVVVASR